MTDTAWLIVAIVAGVVLGAAWIAREVWIVRRRRRQAPGDDHR